MQRDLELIRRLLIEIETLPYPNEYISFKWADQDAEVISYHVNLMHEGALIQAFENQLSCFYEWNDVRLTWHGHELLELIRDPNTWQSAKNAVEQFSHGNNLELIKQHLLQRRAA